MYSSSKYFEDLFLKYKSDKEFVNKYISALNAKFNKCKIVTELDY